MRQSVKLLPLALASAMCFAGSAQATFTVYTTQASYLAAISAPGVDNYNDLTIAPTGSPLNRTAGAYTYQAAAGPASAFYPAGTATDKWLATDNRTDTITFSNFSSTVRGVGGFFFRSDIAGAITTTPATLTLVATDGSGNNTQTLINPGMTTFLGFVSNGPITSLALYVGVQGVGTAGVWPTVNDLTLGAAPAAGTVPEPTTWALMIAGFGLTGAAVRRRRPRVTFA